jgi:LysM repeat protein
MHKNRNYLNTIFCLCAAIFLLNSCARSQNQLNQPGIPPQLLPQPIHLPTYPAVRSDICHVVAPLETVWRISKMYDVSVDTIIRTNNLRSNGEIEKGQKLIIPSAAPWKPVIPLYPSNKWKYIIIHHTATDAGSALSIDRAHIDRGFWNGLGYHFLIDNGTDGKADGQIEVAPRWIKQQEGAHCKAGDMNVKSIGISLVGDYTLDTVSRNQMDSLIYLIDKLCAYYGIPKNHIIGHGQVEGASTECPGKNFPWNEFWRRLS